MTIKATWENIELTEKAHSVNSYLEIWENCGWLPEQLVEHGLARITQPVFIDGAEYLLKDSSGHGDAALVRYSLGTNTFYEVGKPFGFSAPVSDFGKHFTVELVSDPSAAPVKPEIQPDSPFHADNVSGDGISIDFVSESGFYPLKSLVPGRQHPRNKYDREIIPGIYVDVYDVLEAFDPQSKAIDHAVKKLLAPGQRGVKDRITDLNEAMSSIQREIERLGEWSECSDRATGEWGEK